MTQLEATAYHEAGHAVLTLWHDRSFRKATIVAGSDYLGKVYGRRTSLKLGLLEITHPTGRLRTWAEINTQVFLAGPEAERRFTGRRNKVGASSDHLRALDIASAVNGGADNTSDKWLAWQESVTENVVDQAWSLIERGAAALLEHKTLTGPEFRELVYLRL